MFALEFNRPDDLINFVRANYVGKPTVFCDMARRDASTMLVFTMRLQGRELGEILLRCLTPAGEGPAAEKNFEMVRKQLSKAGIATMRGVWKWEG